MQTLKFSKVVYGVAQLAGLDRDNLPNHFFKQVRDLANTRLDIAWETEYWPDLIKTASTVVTTTSDVSSMAYPSDAGEILAVYDKDPAKTTSLSTVGYILRDDASDSSDNSGKTINVFKTTTPLFVEYRISRPDLDGDVWETGTYTGTSTTSVQVYHSGTGNFYSTILSTANEPDHGDWSKVLMPKIFENYLIRGIYADYLRANGQSDIAASEDNNAEAMLVMECDKVYRQQGQISRLNFIGY
jgi:hypothetical protein